MKIRSALGLFALAGAAALVLALAACGDSGGGPSGGGGGDELEPLAGFPDSESGGVLSSLDSAAEVPAPAATGAASSIDSQGGSGDNLPSAVDRKITRDASLEISVDNVLASVSQVEDIAVTSGGFVSNSSLAVTNTEDGEDIETATVRIRVPAAAYTDVLVSSEESPKRCAHRARTLRRLPRNTRTSSRASATSRPRSSDTWTCSLALPRFLTSSPSKTGWAASAVRSSRSRAASTSWTI